MNSGSAMAVSLVSAPEGKKRIVVVERMLAAIPPPLETHRGTGLVQALAWGAKSGFALALSAVWCAVVVAHSATASLGQAEQNCLDVERLPSEVDSSSGSTEDAEWELVEAAETAIAAGNRMNDFGSEPEVPSPHIHMQPAYTEALVVAEKQPESIEELEVN